MHYNEFMRDAEALEPDQADKYVKLKGWCGMDRPAIDSIKDGMVRFTAKHFIGVTVPQDSFRIDTNGSVYLDIVKYVEFLPFAEKTEFVQEHGDPNRPNLFKELPF